jgi:hypothetical protein
MPTMSRHGLADECARVSDKLNNLLTAIQLRASMLLEESETENRIRGLRIILQVSKEAAAESAKIKELSDPSTCLHGNGYLKQD